MSAVHIFRIYVLPVLLYGLEVSIPRGKNLETLEVFLRNCIKQLFDSGYPHDGRADKNPYPHDRRADKDSYPHDSKNQCIILRLQLSFVMINVQLMLV